MRRLAAEIPDIFIPLSRNENSGMTMIFLTVMFFPPGILSHPRQRPAALSPRKVITVLTTTAATLPSSLHISTR